LGVVREENQGVVCAQHIRLAFAWAFCQIDPINGDGVL
jgi:hypothetical protein